MRKKQTDLIKIGSNDKWTSAQLNAFITGGKAKVSFYAKGKGMVQCLIDDISLVAY